MRIATWNINSVRIRLHLLEELVRTAAPDIVCLQEIKAQNADVPEDALRALGFPHVVFSGMKGYNGVAILSRVPLGQVERRDWCGRSDARHISAKLPDGTELHNFYVPAGGDVPDPSANDKFAHKLQFLDEMTEWFPEARDSGQPMILVGDLNIAPLETDVWSHKQLLKVRAALQLVELSRARLVGRGQGPPARPYLGHAAADAAHRGGRGAARRPRLGTRLGPRAGDPRLEGLRRFRIR
jgi:exodeoxyribonuclease-3